MATKKPAKKKRDAMQAAAVELPEQYATRTEYRKCGKALCRVCRDGPGHGPYRYATWTANGKAHNKYLGRDDGRPVFSPSIERSPGLADQLGLKVPGTNEFDEQKLLRLNGAWMLTLLGRTAELNASDPIDALGMQMAKELPSALVRHSVTVDEWASWMAYAVRDAKRKR